MAEVGGDLCRTSGPTPPLKQGKYININCVFFKEREVLNQALVKNVSEAILGTEYKESFMGSYTIPGFCVNVCQHLKICQKFILTSHWITLQN